MWLWSQVREGTHQPVIGWQPHRNSWFLTRVCVCVLECVCIYIGTHTFVCIYVCVCNYCSCSVVKSCLTICDHINCSTPGFPVLHYLPEFAQTHVHWISNAIQPSSSVVPFSLCPQYLPVCICVFICLYKCICFLVFLEAKTPRSSQLT